MPALLLIARPPSCRPTKPEYSSWFGIIVIIGTDLPDSHQLFEKRIQKVVHGCKRVLDPPPPS